MRALLISTLCSVALLAAGASAQSMSFGSSPLVPTPGPAATNPVGTSRALDMGSGGSSGTTNPVGTTNATGPSTTPDIPARVAPPSSGTNFGSPPQGTFGAAPNTGINAGKGGGSGTGTGGGAGGPINNSTTGTGGGSPRTEAPSNAPAIAVGPQVFGVPGLVSGAPAADPVDARPVNPQFAPMDFKASEINHATTATNFNSGAINYAAGAIQHRTGEIDHSAGAIDYAGRQ